MADESVMNISHHISASLVLGSVLVAATPAMAEEVGVGSVELIPFPEGSTNYSNSYFSRDGELQLFHDFGRSEQIVYRFVDGEWIVIRRALQSVAPGLTPCGVSTDGEQIALSDFSRLDVIVGPAVITLPRRWSFNEYRNGRLYVEDVFGDVWGGHMSADGQVVTMVGREFDQNEFDSLAWIGGDELVNLNADLPRDGYSYGAGIPNQDGSIIYFGGTSQNQDPAYRAERIWRWKDGELFELPPIGIFDTELIRVKEVSADGEIVFGNVEGPARGGFAYRELEDFTPWAQSLFGQNIGWYWTESEGIVEIIDRARFIETHVGPVKADGSMALVFARLRGTNKVNSYLWFGGNKFVELDQLLHTLNISIEADFYSFNEMSEDGTKLMGVASVDGEINSHAIIVTIPDLAP